MVRLVKVWIGEIKNGLLDYDRKKMLNVIEKPTVGTVSLLDVGCGYGALADLIKELKIDIDYVGIDVVPEMVSAAEKTP